MPEQKQCIQCGTPYSKLKDGLCPQCDSIGAETIGSEVTPSPFQDATMAPGSAPDTTGTVTSGGQFGDYELIEEIARGGMGVVYKAKHNKLNRIAAVKMILGGRFSSEDEVQRFQIEAEAAAQLDHPGIVPVYEIGEQDGQAFFAMRYIEGGSLAEQMDRFRDDPRKAIRMLSKVARAVHHAHQRGILHRDLKPANILIDESDNPLVTDLGLAKSTSGDSNLTNTGAVLGSPSYMPPEQASGTQSVTTAADIFAIGAIMYELLTGSPPHKGASAMETVMKVITEKPAAPRKIDKSIDPELELICLKCLEHEPDARYGTAANLADDLDSWMSGESISIKSPSIGLVVGRWMRQHRRAVYVGFAAMLGLAFSLPIVTAFFGSGTNLGDVYQHFPNEKPPWFFSLTKLPEWASAISVGLLLLVVWPSIGLWNAIVTRPKTIRAAIGAGFLTSAICAAITLALVGWLIVILSTANESDQHLRALGKAVWVPENTTPEQAEQAALDAYDGLKDIPVNERAEIFADRVITDQIEAGPKYILIILFIGSILAVPVIYGTVFAYILQQRKTAKWLLVIRYGIAWVATSFVTLFVFALVFDEAKINGRPAREIPGRVAVYILIGTTVIYLVLRRWNKSGKRSGQLQNESTGTSGSDSGRGLPSSLPN